MKVVATRHPSLVDQVSEDLNRQIRLGAFSPGEMLPSVQSLAGEWSVSRTVIREGLARLSSAGLVTSRQGLGFFVAESLPLERLELPSGSDPGNLASILELRIGLETEAAGLAALRRKDKDLVQMQRALDVMQEALHTNQIDRGIHADVEFHRTICLAVGNTHYDRLFTFLYQFLLENISVSRRNSASYSGAGTEAELEHEAILLAIHKGDAPSARAAMRRHLVNTGRRLTISDVSTN